MTGKLASKTLQNKNNSLIINDKKNIDQLVAIIGRPPSSEEITKLEIYVKTLTQWGARINLLAPGEYQYLWQRHILDCLQLLPIINKLAPEAPITDWGSGAGLPGLLIAIFHARPVCLIERDQKKASFLREAARLMGVSCNVIDTDIATQPVKAGIITARALASLGDLLELMVAYAHPNCHALFLKSSRGQDELASARATFAFTSHTYDSRTQAGSLIIHLTGVTRHANS